MTYDRRLSIIEPIENELNDAERILAQNLPQEFKGNMQ